MQSINGMRGSIVTLALLVGACGSSSKTGSGNSDGGSSDEGGSSFHLDGGHHDATKGDGAGGTGNDAQMLIVGDGGGGGPLGDAACGTTREQAQKLPVDIVLGIDTSFSMDFESKWTNLSAAIDSFVSDPASAGLDLGIQFFPLHDTCDVSAYEALAVPVGPATTNAPLIMQAIAGTRPAGGTPTVQLLQGLVEYLTLNTTPGFKPVIVLATDGVPDSTCLAVPDGGTPNSLANAEAIAAAAFQGTPSIPIFVIGVGSDLTALNALAAAGGTGSATLIDVGADAGNSTQAFINALNAIRQQAIPCQFAIPAAAAVDPSLTNVEYTPSSGATQLFDYVGSAANCSSAPTTGWYFDNPMMPTQVILCSGACSVVKSDPGAQVNVVLGCPRTNAK